jgi:hypothetical protein
VARGNGRDKGIGLSATAETHLNVAGTPVGSHRLAGVAAGRQKLATGRAMTGPTCFMGVDVQATRGCPYVVLDECGDRVDSGWLEQSCPAQLAQTLLAVVDQHRKGGTCQPSVGIDAPRMPLPSPRPWFWDRTRNEWRGRRASEEGNG